MFGRFLPSDLNINLKDAVRRYHSTNQKLKYKEISLIISTYRNKRLTPNRLKQINKLEWFNRRKNVTGDQLNDIIVMTQTLFLRTIGYKQTTENSCIKYNMNMSEEDLKKGVEIVNCEGIEERK